MTWEWSDWDKRLLAFCDTEMKGIYTLFITVKPSRNPNRYLKFLCRTLGINKATGQVDIYSGNFSGFNFPKRERT